MTFTNLDGLNLGIWDPVRIIFAFILLFSMVSLAVLSYHGAQNTDQSFIKKDGIPLQGEHKNQDT
jgi:hypothetical protein